MTDETFAEIIALLARAYGMTFDAETKRVWRLLLDPLPDSSAREAAVTLCRSSPYPPKPSDLFRAVFGSEKDEEQRLEEEAGLAIAHLEEHLCDYRMCDFGPVLNATVRALGGLDAVSARMATDGWKFDRARAKTLYRAYRRRGVSEEAGGVLIPAVVAEGMAQTPLSVYQERGVTLPLVRVPFTAGRRALLGGSPVRQEGLEEEREAK